MSQQPNRKTTNKRTVIPDPIIRAGCQIAVDESLTSKLPTEVQQQIADSDVITADITLAYVGDTQRKKDPVQTFRQLRRMEPQELVVKGYYYRAGKNPALALVVFCGSAKHYMILCLPKGLSAMSFMEHLGKRKYGDMIPLDSKCHIPFRPFKSTRRGRYVWE